MPTCWGYARRSTEYEEQAESLTRQQSRIREKFQQIAPTIRGLKMGHIFAETQSATTSSYTERTECVRMLSALQKKDHLIVENLDRLDRNGIRQVDCLRELQKRHVYLWVLDNMFFPNGVDLNSYYGQAMVLASAMQTVQWGQRASEGRKRSLAQLKKVGKPYTRNAPLGFKWGEDEEGRSMWVADFDARTLIREIILRRAGAWYATPLKRERITVLARELIERKAWIAGSRGKSNNAFKTPGNKQFMRRYLAKYVWDEKRKKKRLYYQVLLRVCKIYKREFLDGFEFGIPLETIVSDYPERRDEIEYLKRYFAASRSS